MRCNMETYPFQGDVLVEAVMLRLCSLVMRDVIGVAMGKRGATGSLARCAANGRCLSVFRNWEIDFAQHAHHQTAHHHYSPYTHSI
jgi:hypothetical protein